MIPVLHICLAGPQISRDFILIQELCNMHQVTLVGQVQMLSHNHILTNVDVIVLDCSHSRASVLSTLNFLQRSFPNSPVVLVNGGLSQEQIASAFREGVKDYFPYPYDVNLLVERLQILGHRLRSNS